MPLSRYAILFLSGLILLLGTACTRNTIEFGAVPENNYTRLVYIDSVGIRFSTVLTDSFATGNATAFLLGKYKDPYLGTVTARPFFQLDKPAEIPEIPSTAVYDSITFLMRPNDYYYGDTSRLQTISVSELSQTIVTAYANSLYNTSQVNVKPDPLGERTLLIRPAADDSISIRLSDVKGMELFTKIKQQAADVTSSESFLNYFKGIALATGANDTTAVFGLLGAAGNAVMRIHYHTNTPYEERHIIDFPSLANELAFNRVVTDRTGTGITSGPTGVTEIPAGQTSGYVFSQPGTGLNLKLTFPSLRSLLLSGSYIRLLKADLIIRPARLSFDPNKYKLPANLYLAATDASNITGNVLADSTGSSALYASPWIDDIYGENTHYRFNITSYINQLLQTPGSENSGLYVLPSFSASEPNADRLVMQTVTHDNYTTELQLSVLIINK